MAADSQRATSSVEGSGTTALIQFAREPVPGRVKTRLLPVLTPEEACAVHCELVEWVCTRLLRARLGVVTVAVAGDPSHALFDRCLARGAGRIAVQQGEDLGARMARAISSGLQECQAVILVGSDCPAMDTAYLQRARAALDEAPVVLGPAMDGGYVLIGSRVDRPELFQAIPWGTGEVLELTRQRLRAAGMSWQELEPLADIDRPQDLPLWQAIRGAGENGAG